MKRNWRSCIALILSLAWVLAMPPLSGIARAVDLDTACSLTVEPGGPELAEDLKTAEVVLDLYKVADATAVPGIDTYSYEVLPAYADLTIGEEMDNAAWKELAQQAARVALTSEAIQPDTVGASSGTEITGLEAGLYLVVARGQDLERYMTTLTDAEGNEKLATKAESREYIYTFLPELVSVPTKEPDENGVVSTANPGDWIYSAQITLKPEQSPRLGSLEIVKGLDGFVTGRPATFVFDVEGVLDGETVYSNVFSMNFGEAGTQRLQVDGIPVGAAVTVTEIYSGVTYQLTTASSQTAVIEAEDIVSVSFVNTPNDSQKDGGSITNSFTYVDGKWEWQSIPDIP